MKGVKGFQKGNKIGIGNKHAQGHVPWNKDLPPEEQPNYKDGRSFIRGRDWSKQKEKCYKRDDYSCKKCKKKDSIIQCHHLIPYEKTQDNRLSNLITVCVSCHTKEHSNGFKKGNNYWKNRKNHVTPNGTFTNKQKR